MNNEPDIPLLQDLLYRGQPETEQHEIDPSFDENEDFKIEQDTQEIEEPHQQTLLDELEQDSSIQELLIDEEIRMILDKHMDKAYEEIIRLLKHKIS